MRNALAIFVAVGTNAGPDGMPDLTQLWSAADLIASSMDSYKVLAIKSTVPVGTAAAFETRVSERLTQPLKFDVVSNPEFLREGSAVDDFFHPNRIVIGSASERAAAIMKDIYRPLYLIQTPFVFTTREEAELIKYASNAFLGSKFHSSTNWRTCAARSAPALTSTWLRTRSDWTAGLAPSFFIPDRVSAATVCPRTLAPWRKWREATERSSGPSRRRWK